jgi:hypothetical protein
MNDKPCLPVQSFYGLTNPFGFLELEISISACDEAYVDGWLGAALRNNLLYAAEHVNVIGAVSLRQVINLLPLRQDHPLYSEMKGGFPKGFGIALLSHGESVFSCRLQKDETLRFSILLYGHFSEYKTAFVQAVENMCTRGIGKPMVPFRLESITEKPFIRLSDFTNNKCKADECEITIRYTAPTNLYNEYKNIQGHKDRQHEFPGFNQLVHSLSYRIAKLATLYTCPENKDFYPEIEAAIEPFAQYAVTVVLVSAQIQRIELCSTARKGTPDRVRFSGYTGTLTFTGHFNYYLPLLLFMQNIGAGSHTTYGLGRYRVVIK